MSTDKQQLMLSPVEFKVGDAVIRKCGCIGYVTAAGRESRVRWRAVRRLTDCLIAHSSTQRPNLKHYLKLGDKVRCLPWPERGPGCREKAGQEWRYMGMMPNSGKAQIESERCIGSWPLAHVEKVEQGIPMIESVALDVPKTEQNCNNCAESFNDCVVSVTCPAHQFRNWRESIKQLKARAEKIIAAERAALEKAEKERDEALSQAEGEVFRRRPMLCTIAELRAQVSMSREALEKLGATQRKLSITVAEALARAQDIARKGLAAMKEKA